MPIAILIIQALLQYGPEAAQKIQQILAKEKVEEGDWAALWALIEKDGASYFEDGAK